MRQIKDRMVAKLLTHYPSLFKWWAHKSKFIEFADTPWTQFDAEVSNCRLALITTGGVHLKGQAPFNMNDPSGDPSFREIPADTPSSSLSITHNYYDHTDAEKDLNILLPLDRVWDLKKTGEIGSVNGRHFSFMGHIKHHHIDTLMNETALRIAETLNRDEVDIVILAPAWGICNQSVGLIQRVIEAQGIATISVSLSKEITQKVRPPRSLFSGFPLGHPFGFPGQSFRQLQVIRILLKYLKEIRVPGTIVELDLNHIDKHADACTVCDAE